MVLLVLNSCFAGSRTTSSFITLLSRPIVGLRSVFTMSFHVVYMLPVFYRPAVGYLQCVCCLVVATYGGTYVDSMFVSGGWICRPVVGGGAFSECLSEWGLFVYLAHRGVWGSGTGRSGVGLSGVLCLCDSLLVALYSARGGGGVV